MRKIIVVLICIASLFAFALPASACGGFVAIKGEKIFHSVYCDNLEFENLDNMRWFDTAKKAKNSGLHMCEECSDYSDWDFDSEYCDSFWETSDHLLLTAMELSVEYGVYSSEEYWYEHFYDQYGYLMDSDSYASDFEDDYSSGYKDDYISGYEDGFAEGLREAERKAEAEEKQKQEQETNKTSWIVYAAGAVILYLIFKIGVYAGEKRNNKTIGELHTENTKLHQALRDQHDATYVLDLICKKSGMANTVLAESLFINYLKSQGFSEENAREELKKEKQNFPHNK